MRQQPIRPIDRPFSSLKNGPMYVWYIEDVAASYIYEKRKFSLMSFVNPNESSWMVPGTVDPTED